MTQLSTELDIPYGTLSRWVSEYRSALKQPEGPGQTRSSYMSFGGIQRLRNRQQGIASNGPEKCGTSHPFNHPRHDRRKKIYELEQSKRELIETVIQQGDHALSKISEQDIREILNI